jgi:hypothetical protein
MMNVLAWGTLAWPDEWGSVRAPSDWSAVALWVTALILLGTAIYAVFQLQDARRTRHAELLIHLTERLDSDRIVESHYLFYKRKPTGVIELRNFLTNRPEEVQETHYRDYTTLIRVPELYELIGVLRADKALNRTVIWRMWGPQIIAVREAWTEPIEDLKKAVSWYPRPYRYLTLLADEMREEYEREERRLRKAALGDPEPEHRAGVEAADRTSE